MPVICSHACAEKRSKRQQAEIRTFAAAVIRIRIINLSDNPNPEYATPHSAGLDLRAFLDAPADIAPGARRLIPTGLQIELPPGCEAQIRPRSGLALHHGITLLNSPGTIDADYRGEIRVIVINLSDIHYTVQPGEKIAQMVIAKYETVTWENTEALSATSRNNGGFGHSGKI